MVNGYGGTDMEGAINIITSTATDPPKKMSGVLTMPASINPAYGSDSKMRTLISATLTCFFAVPDHRAAHALATAFQTQYIPQISHRDKAQGCLPVPRQR